MHYYKDMKSNKKSTKPGKNVKISEEKYDTSNDFVIKDLKPDNAISRIDPSFKKDNIVVGDYSINQDDLYAIGDAEIDDKGLVYHHLSSANDLYTNGIPQIITQIFKVERDINNQRTSTPEDKLIDTINVVINFTEVFISKPTVLNYFSGKEEILYPNMALLSDKTYSANLRVNATIKATAFFKDGTTKERNDKIDNFKLCRIPVMVKSLLCNTHDLSKEALIRLNEDPSDPGGYFIIKGIEWVIDCIENILFNQIRIFKNEGYSKEVMRVEFVSKPGDTYQNSDYFIMRLFNDNQLTCEVLRNQLNGIQIPFYLMFRILGWSSDKEMFDNIIYGYDDDISKNIINYIIESMNVRYSVIPNGRYVYSQLDCLKLIIENIKYTDFKYFDLDNNPENYKIAYNKLLSVIDANFLPHIGLLPSDRPKKARFLGLIIRKVFLVKMGNLEPNDRDSYKSKRIHAAGTSYAKNFKTYFNASIIQQIKRRLLKDFKSMSFSQVDLASSVRASVYGADFERSIMQTITSGNKSQITVNKKSRINRLSTQLLDRKNQIAVYSTLRQVTTTSSDSSKQSERANELRRVHMSFLGYICCVHSSDGEKVGVNKQIAIFASILGATSSDVLKDTILSDPDIIPIDKTTPSSIYENNLHNIYINGEWVGCAESCLDIVIKYRKLRRMFKINPLTTIYWDNTQEEAYFWVDMGRPVRPLMIVYNNKRDPEYFKDNKYKSTNFLQGLAITEDILNKVKTKEITIEYLIKNNIIEYITPEEQENCYLSPCFDQLREDKNNELHEYTHCDIPQSILGITALIGPFANHNQIPRITYQTSQCRQTCGVFTLNWPFRCDKDTFIQYVCETPLISTISNKYIFPNGSNVVVAIACYSGYNQEDSLVISQGAVDRGLFDGSKFTFYKAELEQKEDFGNPDVNTTEDVKNANYSKLMNGVLKAGVTIKKGDAIIGKHMKIPKNENGKTSIDRSVIYKETEDAIVNNVIIDRNEDDERFCKISMRKIRPVTIGDKFCLTPEHEVLTSTGWKNIIYVTSDDLVATLHPEFHYMEYHNPSTTQNFRHTGHIYYVKNNGVSLSTTLNHRMYIKNKTSDMAYHLVEASAIIGTPVIYKRDCSNKFFDITVINIEELKQIFTNYTHEYFNKLLEFFGIYLSIGKIVNDVGIKIPIKNYNIKTNLIEMLKYLDINYKINTSDNRYLFINDVNLCNYFTQFLSINKRIIPTWCNTLSHKQANILLQRILDCSGTFLDNGNITYYTYSKSFANSIQILALLTEKSANIISSKDSMSDKVKYFITIETSNINMNTYTGLNTKEGILKYDGYVYCITVPNGIFMTRKDNIQVWTGNSSRAGQKGVCGMLLRDSDMPFTKDGIRPEIIVNPHAIPSRMTIGQLYESQMGNYCAMKGTHSDATIFRHVDIESIAAELEEMGMNKYGYHRLYSGITGEHMDCLIFMGPTYYQRLQKFVNDAVYSIIQGPSDVLTRQPLDGKSSFGGIRVGEMERDVICSHGSSKFMQEKFFDHSDGFTEYICRCGKSAIVNAHKNMYKCKYCKDNADIAAVPTSWSSKLFIQEMETMNVGIRRHLTPFTYESVQEKAISDIVN